MAKQAAPLAWRCWLPSHLNTSMSGAGSAQSDRSPTAPQPPLLRRDSELRREAYSCHFLTVESQASCSTFQNPLFCLSLKRRYSYHLSIILRATWNTVEKVPCIACGTHKTSGPFLPSLLAVHRRAWEQGARGGDSRLALQEPFLQICILRRKKKHQLYF